MSNTPALIQDSPSPVPKEPGSSKRALPTQAGQNRQSSP